MAAPEDTLTATAPEDVVLPTPTMPTSILERLIGAENSPDPLVINGQAIGAIGGKAALLSITDSSGGTAGMTLAAQTLPSVLVDSTGGTPATTLTGAQELADIAASLAAQHNLVVAQLTALRNALATLAAHHNATIAVWDH